MRAYISCCFIHSSPHTEPGMLVFLTQAGTDTDGHCARMYTHTHTHTPSPQTTKSIAWQREKVCYRIDQNPWSQQSI